MNKPVLTAMERKRPKFDYYKHLETGEEITISQEWKNHLARDLYIWARDDIKAYKLSAFYVNKGIHPRDFDRWCATHERLQLAKEAALILIGNRREDGAIEKRYDTSIVNRTMPMYDIEWKRFVEWYSKLKAESEGKGLGNVTVIIPPFEEPKVSREQPEDVARRARNGMVRRKRVNGVRKK
jgi:hypothetical protein